MSSIDVSVNVFDASFSTLWGMTFDTNNNYYVANFSSNYISKISYPSLDVSYNWCYLGTGSIQLTSLAYCNYDGYLYALGFGVKTIYKININDATFTNFVTDASYSMISIAINNNYLYTSGFQANNPGIYRYDINSGVGNLTYPIQELIFALTVDNLDNIYTVYRKNSNNYLFKLNSATGFVDFSLNYTSTTNYFGIAYLATDVSNSVFISNSTGNISQYDANNGSLINIDYINTSGFYQTGIAFNNNYLYFVNQNNNTIYKGTTPSCFNFDTKILCLNNLFQDEYIPIQNLKSGDFVKTYLYGYRKIDLIGKISFMNNSNILNCIYKMEKTDENGLIEDLIITGGHSILVDSISDEEQERYCEQGLSNFVKENRINDKYLLLACVSDKFNKITCNDIFTCYQIVLENNGNDNERFGIWTNGILTETSSKNYFKTQNYTLL